MTHQPAWTKRAERAIPKLDVPALRTLDVDVHDNLRPFVFVLLGRPLLALVAFVATAINGWWAATPLVVWFLYGSNLSAIHHLVHGGMGLTPRWRHFWLSVLACLVAESGHALLATHTVHHRDGTDLPDPEGYIEYLTWAQMPVGAARYRYRLMYWGLRNSNRPKRIAVEIAIHAGLHLASLALLFNTTPLLWIYLSLVHVSSFVFAVLQGKGPQANFGRPMSSPLMFVHTKVLAFVFFSHHQHLEHHAYPKVPLPRLHLLRPHIEQALADEEVLHLQLAA